VKSAFDHIVAEKLMMYAQTAVTRPEFARDLPKFVAKIRRLFSSEEIHAHLARIEREDRDAAETARGAPRDDLDHMTRL
jgi:hypothetical protein